MEAGANVLLNAVLAQPAFAGEEQAQSEELDNTSERRRSHRSRHPQGQPKPIIWRALTGRLYNDGSARRLAVVIEPVQRTAIRAHSPAAGRSTLNTSPGASRGSFHRCIRWRQCIEM